MKSYLRYILLALSLLILNHLRAQPLPHPDSLYEKSTLERYMKEFHEKNNIKGLAMTYLAKAKSQERWNLPDESPIESYRKSMDYFRVLGDSLHYYEVKGSLGTYFMDRPIFASYANEYLSSAVLYFRKIHRPDMEIGHLINLANSFSSIFCCI